MASPQAMDLDIPKTQKAAVFDTPGAPIEIRQLPVPEPAADQVLVKLLYTGVCHSDLHIWQGEFGGAMKLPLVGGHEGAGLVVKLGSTVKNLKIGDRVGVKWVNWSCLTCECCKRGFDNNCSTALHSGFELDGTYQQFCLVKATEAAVIPEGIDMAVAAPILCAGVTVYKALKVSEVQAGQIVAITGAGGGLGSIAIQYAKAMGMQVLAMDAGAKEEHCRNLGADYFIDPFKCGDIVEAVLKLTNGGPHGVINVATSTRAMDDSCKYVRTHGTVVIVALPKDGKVTFDILSSVFRTINIKCTFVGTRQDVDEALNFCAKGLVNIPVKVEPFSQLVPTFELMQKGVLQGRVVLDLWK